MVKAIFEPSGKIDWITPSAANSSRGALLPSARII